MGGSAALVKSAFDFIDEIERMPDQRQVVDRFDLELKKYGFHAWLITGLPNPGGRIDSLMMLNGWPVGWSELYTKLDLVQNDPVVAHCFRSNVPFEWTDAPYDAETNPRAKDVMDRATDFRMNHGFCVPIHSSEGFQAVVTMAGDVVNLEGHAKRALHLMSLYAYGKALELGRACMPQPKILTKREREILQWTSAGKTAWEVSQILGISEQTVVTHLKAAAVKFDAPNRTATVVAALRRGEISL